MSDLGGGGVEDAPTPGVARGGEGTRGASSAVAADPRLPLSDGVTSTGGGATSADGAAASERTDGVVAPVDGAAAPENGQPGRIRDAKSGSATQSATQSATKGGGTGRETEPEEQAAPEQDAGGAASGRPPVSEATVGLSLGERKDGNVLDDRTVSIGRAAANSTENTVKPDQVVKPEENSAEKAQSAPSPAPVPPATGAHRADTRPAGQLGMASGAGAGTQQGGAGTQQGAAGGPPAETERTKQQPLPPQPEDPLKLLAALTNTPPPPETPLRVFARRVKIWTPLVVLLLLAVGVAQMLRPLPQPELQLSMAASHTFSGSEPRMPWPAEGQAAIKVEGLGSFGSDGGDEPRPIASVTKVMTAYVILKEHPLKKGEEGPLITVDQEAEDHYKRGLPENESLVKVEAGQKISQYAALQDVLIPSANNVARLLARWDAGSEQAFVAKMNKAAQDLGMTKTTYTDPSGLDKTTVSTALDQIKLAEAAMDDPVFREIVNTGAYRPAGYTADVYNHNRLLHKDGVVGIKTGNSTAGGANLLFAAEKEVGGTTQLIVGAVLGQRGVEPAAAAAASARELIVAARDTLTSTTLVKKGQVVGHVDDGLGTRTPLLATEDVVAVGWPGLTVKTGIEAKNGTVPHQASAGEPLGTLTVGDGPGQVKVPVTPRSATEEPSNTARLLRIL